MDIEQWFKKGDYDAGVRIYASIPKANRNILNRLKRGETPRNRATLKYELNKLKNYVVPVPPVPTPVETITKKEQEPSKEISATKALQQTNGRVTMAMLPDPYLRKRFVEKNQAFYKRWEIKWQLNQVPPGDENKALELITEIMKLTRLIDAVWMEIDYFLEHKKILTNSSADYSKMSALAKVKERQKLWQKKSKRESTLRKWKSELPAVSDKAKKHQLKAKIEKQEEMLNKIWIDIQNLNELIDE